MNIVLKFVFSKKTLSLTYLISHSMNLGQQQDNYGYNKLNIQYGIQTVFSTIPFQSVNKEVESNDNKTAFENDIEKFYFEEFRDNLKFEDENIMLYKPLKFFMLGDYDVLYVTLINNFKFSHRLFEPIVKTDDKDYVYNTHTFQSFSGFVLNQNENQIQKIFKSAVVNDDKIFPVSYFVGVINLKLNNGLFIGNGLIFIEKVCELIKNNLNIRNLS